MNFIHITSIFNSFQGRNNLDHFRLRPFEGRNFMLVRDENLPMESPWEKLESQFAQSVGCPWALGQKKGQSLLTVLSPALRDEVL